MKKYYLIIIIFGLLIGLNAQAQENRLELGKRYIKLGGSFRESGEFALSKKFLTKGLNIVKKSDNIYWTAVAKEYLGYYWRDRAQIEGKDIYYCRALNYFYQALIIYRNVLKLNSSSIVALKKTINNLRNGRAYSGGGDVGTADNKMGKGGSAEMGNALMDNDCFDSEDNKMSKGGSAEMGYMDKALKALFKHDFDLAKKYLKKILKENPDSEMAKYLLYIIPRIEKYPSPGLNYQKISIITSKKELKSDYINHDEVDIIDLSNSDGVTKVPQGISEFPNVKILNLSNNDITKIKEDDELCELQNLRILDLSYNELTSIPECIKYMPKLQVLYLRGNDIPFAEILKLKDKNPYLQIVMDEEE